MWDDPKVVAALVAVITSIITIIFSSLIKSIYDKKFHVFKLECEHRYEQRKKIKGILSANKIHLINACESLNHRLWNFSSNHKKNWQSVGKDYTNKDNYYFYSFVYRIICVLSWIRRIENEMVYLDTTIATKDDLEFIKFLRVFPETICDLYLMNGIDHDPNHQTDHLFRGKLEHMVCFILKDGVVCDFSTFQENLDRYMIELEPLCQLIDGISPDEQRYRWDRLQVLHLTTMAFLNSYGYDFQVTQETKLRTIINKPRKSRLLSNFISMLERDKLSKQKQIKKMIKVVS